MDAGSGFPIDLVLRLRSILGRRTGYERPPAAYQPNPQGAGSVIEGKAEPAAPASAHVLPDPAGPVGQTLARIRGVDGAFEPAGFLDGAEKAFRIIVGAYAAGDRVALRQLLSD